MCTINWPVCCGGNVECMNIESLAFDAIKFLKPRKVYSSQIGKVAWQLWHADRVCLNWKVWQLASWNYLCIVGYELRSTAVQYVDWCVAVKIIYLGLYPYWVAVPSTLLLTRFWNNVGNTTKIVPYRKPTFIVWRPIPRQFEAWANFVYCES